MDKKPDLKRAHDAEMKQAAQKPALRIVTAGQVKAARAKYASLCAEYLACTGIYTGFHDAGFHEKASPFAVAATIASESMHAVGEVLDLLGIQRSAD